MYVLRESRRPAPGQQHGYSLEPSPGPGCEVVWYINGQPVNVGSKVGGLEVKGIGGGGTMTVEVVGDVSTTRVHVRVDCPDDPAEQVGPMRVGTGAWDPCAMEPCQSLRAAYADAVRAALDASTYLARWCVTVKLWRAFLFLLLLTLALVLVAIVLCHVLFWPPIVCMGLYVALAIIAVALLSAEVTLGIVTSRMLDARLDCLVAKARMSQARLEMILNCPQECWLPEVPVDCECR